MGETVRVSVRQLVEFSIHGEDLLPGGNMRDMRAGARGHQARQALLPAGWEAERCLSRAFEEEGLTLVVTGRMDACRQEPPAIEEIKLWQGAEAPAQPLPAHWAQGVVYGYLWGKPRVTVSLCYVDIQGHPLARFEEALTLADCQAVFEPLYRALMDWHRTLCRHAARRDEALAALAFPYPAYRPGQRKMAAQCYTAISRRKRLFAAMPTGTGKSAAVLFPALKALGRGLTGQVFYLTARNTGRQGAVELLARLRAQTAAGHSPALWALTLEAKDRLCPQRRRCHPDDCPRARGHLARLGAGIAEIQQAGDWSPQAVADVAQRHSLCPFEFALSLAEIADVVICDYNYAFDPGVHIQRVFDRRRDLTLLVDEAHHLLGRTREMLTGTLAHGEIARLRREVGKAAGRREPLYRAMTRTLRALESRRAEAPLYEAAAALAEALAEAVGRLPGADGEGLRELYAQAAAFSRSQGQPNYTLLWGGRPASPQVMALCLSVREHLAKATRELRGVVCFSATLEPLPVMRELLGGEEEDACLALPSPFPKERLLTLRLPIDTRYQARERTAAQVAGAIRACFEAHPGKYMAFFPSFAYLERIAGELAGLPLLPQGRRMVEGERQAFLSRFQEGEEPVLGLCVLGGLFAEGIDLAGERLIGVMIVGVGLPQVNPVQEALRDYYQGEKGTGFAYAYQIPGMQKITQAVGRVIRNEKDQGVALLIDQRYFQKSYEALCPPHWQWREGALSAQLKAFWEGG